MLKPNNHIYMRIKFYIYRYSGDTKLSMKLSNPLLAPTGGHLIEVIHNKAPKRVSNPQENLIFYPLSHVHMWGLDNSIHVLAFVSNVHP